jgi:hypothetical protein
LFQLNFVLNKRKKLLYQRKRTLVTKSQLMSTFVNLFLCASPNKLPSLELLFNNENYVDLWELKLNKLSHRKCSLFIFRVEKLLFVFFYFILSKHQFIFFHFHFFSWLHLIGFLDENFKIKIEKKSASPWALDRITL